MSTELRLYALRIGLAVLGVLVLLAVKPEYVLMPIIAAQQHLSQSLPGLVQPRLSVAMA
jgi:hypothetical protein